jgi:hypothetical protein
MEPFRDSSGRIRLPFGQLGWILRAKGVRPARSEVRAMTNLQQFHTSLIIILGRIDGALGRFGDGSWAGVPIDHLYVDVQSFFLFNKQLVEDVAQVIRLRFGPPIRGQLSPSFDRLRKQLMDEKLLDQSDSFAVLLTEYDGWFTTWDDIRDDICHRTDFGQKRLAEFPELLELVVAAGGGRDFSSGMDLRTYLCDFCRKLYTFLCAAEDFVYRGLGGRYPDLDRYLAPAYMVPQGEIDFTKTSERPQFQPGTLVASLDPQAHAVLESFLKASGAEPPR